MAAGVPACRILLESQRAVRDARPKSIFWGELINDAQRIKQLMPRNALLFIVCLTLLMSPCTYATQKEITGTWVGIVVFDKPVPVRLHFHSDESALNGLLTMPFDDLVDVPLTSVTAAEGEIAFELKHESGVFSFRGTFSSGTLSGQATAAGKSGTFELVRTVTVNPKEFFGAYELESGRRFFIRTWDELGENQLTYFDDEGRVGALHAKSETEFLVGPANWIPLPVETQILFERGHDGKVKAGKWKSKNTDAAKFTRLPHLEEDVTIQGKVGNLAGTLFIPAGTGPFPALVLVHGSGPVTRDFFGPIGYMFASRGIAVICYDKRGVGGSQGHWLDAGFEDYASDALSAVRYLKNRKEIRPDSIGLWGASQAGWIIPQASVEGGDVAFAVMLSVPGVTPFEQELGRTKEEMLLSGMGEDAIAGAISQLKSEIDSLRAEEVKSELESQVQKIQAEGNPGKLNSSGPSNPRFLLFYRRILDYSPIPSLEKMKCPVLVLYGELDRNCPASLNRPLLENAFKKAGNEDVTFVLLPQGDHVLMQSETGSGREFPYSNRFVPGLFEIMVNWILSTAKSD